MIKKKKKDILQSKPMSIDCCDVPLPLDETALVLFVKSSAAVQRVEEEAESRHTLDPAGPA